MPVARVNGIGLHYRVEGRGQPLVMITGFGLDLGSFNAQAACLKRHFTVVRLDNRGAGRTDKPVGPYSTKIMANDVVGLMDHLQIEKAIVLGYSMGGMIAQEMAIGDHRRLDKLVLCSTYSCIDGDSGWTDEFNSLSGMPELAYMLGFLKLTTDSKLKPPVWLLKTILTSNRASVAALKAQNAACATHNALDRLCQIAAPTLVITGSNDRLIRPRSSAVLASRIPNAKLVAIPRGSHLLPIEKPQELNQAVLQFLTG